MRKALQEAALALLDVMVQCQGSSIARKWDDWDQLIHKVVGESYLASREAVKSEIDGLIAIFGRRAYYKLLGKKLRTIQMGLC